MFKVLNKNMLNILSLFIDVYFTVVIYLYKVGGPIAVIHFHMMQWIQPSTWLSGFISTRDGDAIVAFFQPIQQSSCDRAVFLPIDVGHCVASAWFAKESTTG